MAITTKTMPLARRLPTNLLASLPSQRPFKRHFARYASTSTSNGTVFRLLSHLRFPPSSKHHFCHPFPPPSHLSQHANPVLGHRPPQHGRPLYNPRSLQFPLPSLRRRRLNPPRPFSILARSINCPTTHPDDRKGLYGDWGWESDQEVE